MRQVKLTQIEDGDYQRLYAANCGITSAEHGGDDPDTHLFVRIEYTDEWGDNPEYRYHASVVACGPGWPSDENLKSYLDTIGMTVEEFRGFPIRSQCQILVDTGCYATIWQDGGNNIGKLLATARQQLRELNFMIGFRLDANQNAIGSSGWDFMKGDILSGIRR